MNHIEDIFIDFRLDILEEREIIYTSKTMTTPEFLKRDLTLLSEEELCEVFKHKVDSNIGREVAAFWAFLKGSQKLLNVSKLNGAFKFFSNDINIFTKQFQNSYEFFCILNTINWTSIFLKNKSFNDFHKLNTYFYENLAISLTIRDCLTTTNARILNKWSVDWNYINPYKNKSALFILLTKKHIDKTLIEELISYGVDTNCISEGVTALMYVISRKNVPVDIVELLLKNGAYKTIDFQEKTYGRTALMLACIYSISNEIIDILIKAGANVAVKSEFEKYAIDYYRDNKLMKSSDSITKALTKHFETALDN